MGVWSDWIFGDSTDAKTRDHESGSKSGKYSAGDREYMIRETKDRDNDSRNDYPHMTVHVDRDGDVKGAHHSSSKGNQTWGTASGEYDCNGGSDGGSNGGGNVDWEGTGNCK